MKSLSVVFEDSRLIAVCKPAGQVVIPGRGDLEKEPLVKQVTRYLGGKAFVVHRIDRETSGLVVFAKDAASHKELSRHWEEGLVHKTYLALVSGRLERSGLLDFPIKSYGSGRMGVGLGGKPSQTRYNVIRLMETSTLLEVEPLTGRRHQIRVHLYHAGFPILGDPLYGQPRPVGGYSRLMLHALKLELPRPEGPLQLTAEAPPEFIIS
jgi:RluA family pseudouridine synthase